MVGFRIERTVYLDSCGWRWLLDPTSLRLRPCWHCEYASSTLLTLQQLTGGIYLGGIALLNPLSMALIYTFAQEDPNRVVSFFIIQMPAKYLPYASLAITYVIAGPFATMIQATGILAAHLYDFLDRIWPQFGGGQQWIRVPQFVQNAFATPGGTGQTRAYGTAFNARPGGAGQSVPQNQAGSGGGYASGSAWGSRGSGRRLGGD